MTVIIQYIGIFGFIISLISLYFSYNSFKSKQISLSLEQIQYKENLFPMQAPTNRIYGKRPLKGTHEIFPTFYLITDLRITNNSELPISISEFQINATRFSSNSYFNESSEKTPVYYQMPTEEFNNKLQNGGNIVSFPATYIDPKDYNKILYPIIKLEPRSSVEGTLIIAFQGAQLFKELSTGLVVLSAVGIKNYKAQCFLELKKTAFVNFDE